MAQINSGDSLNPPAPSEMPVCVMDGTDVETVVVTSEWTEIELHANQIREDNSESGDHSPPAADSDQRESRINGSTEESEKHTDAENYIGESAPTQNRNDGSVGRTEHMTAEAERLARLNLSCSVTPALESTLTVPVTAADGAAGAAGTRRSARKPKKTWKLKSVNLPKRKRSHGAVTGQKRERTPLAPVRNSRTVTEVDGERIPSDNGSVVSKILDSCLVLGSTLNEIYSGGNKTLTRPIIISPTVFKKNKKSLVILCTTNRSSSTQWLWTNTFFLF